MGRSIDIELAIVDETSSGKCQRSIVALSNLSAHRIGQGDAGPRIGPPIVSMTPLAEFNRLPLEKEELEN